MNRRKFLKWIGIGTGVAVVAPKVLLAKEDNYYFSKEMRDKMQLRINELEKNKDYTFEGWGDEHLKLQKIKKSFANHRIFQFGWDEGWVCNGDVCECEDGHRYICQQDYKMKDGRYLVSEGRVLSRITNDAQLIKVIKEKESKMWFAVEPSVEMPNIFGGGPPFPLEALTRSSGHTESIAKTTAYNWNVKR